MENTMNFYKDENGAIYAYDDEQISLGLASGKTLMSAEETERHTNPVKTKEQVHLEARGWRDAELARADIELNKVQDGMGTGSVSAWRAYRCELRNWPESVGFPADESKPVSP